MKKLGEVLKESRQSKHLSRQEVAARLLLKVEVVEAIESGNWGSLPEPAFVRGFIRSYAEFLDLDAQRLLALYRAEFDEKKYPKKSHVHQKRKKFMFTPEKILPLGFLLAALAFITYLVFQYFSVLSAPKLEIYSPKDDVTITAPIIEITGITKQGATVSIDGEIIPVDESGDFDHEYKLNEGRNVIEIVSSYRLSPKSKVTRVVRLSRN